MAPLATTSSMASPRSVFRLPGIVASESLGLLANLRRSWRVLWALTLIETRRKYAGSVLGTLWYPIYSALLLGSYCFVYMVVFKIRFRDLGSYQYVLFVFAGLIPYLGFSEAISTSASSVRQNLTLLRNAVFPIEFVPVKFVCAALFGLCTSLGILVAMIVPTTFFGFHMLYLPVAVGGLLVFCVMVAWALSAVTVILPDVAYLVNIALLLLMFVSPVGFAIDMVPPRVRFLLFLNPLTYLIELFRYALLGMRNVPFWVDGAFIAACVLGAAISGAFFRRLSPMFADYE
jgi:lipopolysaccharide transport system permease protein